jgi:gliding-associated putative ABC transporter substrate-binding component GldG
MKRKAALIYSIVLIIGIVVLVNILASDFFVRFDLTENNRYTLSDATEDILDDLDQPITITAYFSEDMPQRIAETKSNFRDLLVEYAQRSEGMVNYEIINPAESDQNEKQIVRQTGIQPAMVNVRRKDQMKQQKVYMGAVIKQGSQKEVIPFIQPGSSMEYNISSNIKKLAATGKPFIGIMQGHGEPSMQNLGSVRQSLNVLYKPETFSLSDTANALQKYNTVAIIAPTDSFPESHLEQLDQYLARGGKLFIGLNRVKGDFRRARGTPLSTGLETWLEEKGIQVNSNFVIDANCQRVSVQQPNNPFRFSVEFPYLPIINNFPEHPITKGLEAVSMRFASTVEFVGDSSLTYIPLAKTSQQSGTKSPPLMFNVQKSWSESDFPESGLTVAAALKGNLTGEGNTEMVVVGDGDFPVTQRGQQGGGNRDNVSFMVNSIDWLSDETGLMTLRTKGVTSRPLEQVEESRKTFLKYFNFLLPIVLIIGYGIFRFQHKRILRIKRMEADYV